MKKINLLILVISVLLSNTFIVRAETLFMEDLYFGIKNNSDVIKLQNFLTSQKIYSGPITGNFLSLTLEGVKKFQENHNIIPIAGYFGPVTRKKANEIISSQAMPNPIQTQITALLQQIELLQKQIQLLAQATSSQQQAQTTISPTDITPPVISNIRISYLGAYSAAVTYTTDEPTKTVLYYDTNIDFSSSMQINTENFQTSHGHVISELNTKMDYYCKIEAIDESGNVKVSDPFLFNVQ